jgi:hypothetical protein
MLYTLFIARMGALKKVVRHVVFGADRLNSWPQIELSGMTPLTDHTATWGTYHNRRPYSTVM